MAETCNESRATKEGRKKIYTKIEYRYKYKCNKRTEPKPIGNVRNRKNIYAYNIPSQVLVLSRLMVIYGCYSPLLMDGYGYYHH